MRVSMADARWPDIPYLEWAETCSALHLYSQVVGKYALARTPWLNHSWHATLQVTVRGLKTRLVPDAGGIEAGFDFHDHCLFVRHADGRTASFPLEAASVADFYGRFCEAVAQVGGTPEFDRLPNELPDPVRFDEDRQPRPYDADAVSRFHRALLTIALALEKFRTSFLGKASPVHFFWGSFDLGASRFSGRRAPLHPGGIPHLPDAVTREAYSHEVLSTGFWPGGGGVVNEPAFYAYAYPEPDGFRSARVEPPEAHYHDDLREFILPYGAVRTAADPWRQLAQFLESTYSAGADLLDWDRHSLECSIGRPGLPRQIEPEVIDRR